MGARLLMTFLALCLMPAEGFAQLIGTMPGLRSASLPDTTLTSSINQEDLFSARPRTYAPRYDRLLPRPRQRFGGGYVSDLFVPWDSWNGHGSSYRRSAQFQPNGHLRLLVEPASTEVHLDDFYLGSVEDFRRSGGSIQTGPHRVELRAPGQDPVIFYVNILPYDIVTYRNDLDPAPSNLAPAPSPLAPPPLAPA